MPATLAFADGAEERSVAVELRLKGNYTLQGLDKKPSFKVKLPKNTALGVRRLTLNGMTQDRTFVHEALAYRAYAAAGVPEIRTGYATVSVNGEPYGLYVDVETLDDDFVAEHFGAGAGILYEAAAAGADLREEDAAKFDLEHGDDPGAAAWTELVRAIDLPGDDLFYGPSRLVDPEALVKVLAMSAVLGDWDNYGFKANNYRLHRDAKTNLWTLLPTGQDQSLATLSDPWAFDGRLALKCFGSDRCFAAYGRALRSMADAFEALDLGAQAKKLVALVEAAGRSDPRKPFSNADTEEARKALFATIGKRPDHARRAASCQIDGKEPAVGACGGAVVFGKERCFSAATRGDGTPVLGDVCHGRTSERWRLEADRDAFRLVGVKSGRCLDIADVSTADGARAQIWTCTGAENQRFELAGPGASLTIVAVHSGKCLAERGEAIVQEPCDGSAAQRFALGRSALR